MADSPAIVGVVGGHAAVQRLVDAHVEGHAEERHLHGADGERAPVRAPQGAGGDEADGQARGHELRAEPGEEAEQGEAEEGLAAPDALVQAQRQQGGAGKRGTGGELGVDRGAVGEERGTQAHHRGRAEGPWVGHHAQREAVGQGHGQRGDRGEEQLHPLGPADEVRGQDQEREAHAVGLVQAALGEHAVLVELVGVEVGVGAGDVLVAHVHVVVALQRLGGQQVVGLVPGVVGAPEGVEADGGGVDPEEQDEEGEGPAHAGRKARDAPATRPSPRRRDRGRGRGPSWVVGEPPARLRGGEADHEGAEHALHAGDVRPRSRRPAAARRRSPRGSAWPRGWWRGGGGASGRRRGSAWRSFCRLPARVSSCSRQGLAGSGLGISARRRSTRPSSRACLSATWL